MLVVNEGEIRWSRHEVNPVTWWILKSKGIRVIGPEVTSFHFDVSKRDLAAYVRNNMSTYWLNRMRRLRRFKSLAFLMPNRFSDQELQWCITGMLRQFYTLREYEIISKVDAGYYAMDVLPERWHHIIKEVINIREGSYSRYYTSKKQRMEDALQCMDFIIHCCNKL